MSGIARQPPGTVVLVAVALLNKGKPERALELLDLSLREYPDEFWLHFYAGTAARACRPRLNNDSIGYLRAALALRPSSLAVLNDLGVALSDHGKLGEAIACYHKAIELHPRNVLPHINLGYAQKEQGKLDEAIACFRRAIELDPKMPDPHNSLGNILSDQGELDEAIRCYRRAIELDPKYALAHRGLGVALADQKKTDEAIASYRKAIELDPKYAPAYYNLGNGLHDQKKLDEAIASYNKAIELDPKYAPAYYNLGNALRAQNKLDEAIDAYRNAIELDLPGNPAHWNLAAALKDQGRWAEAIATLEAHVRLKPDFAHTYNNLAWAMATCPDARLRDPPRALEFAKKRHQLAAPDAISWNTLGVVSYRAGDYQATVAAITQSIREGGDGFSWFFLAMSHWQLGQKQEARQWYDKAVAWMESNNKANQDLLRFREEAEQLIMKNSGVRDQEPVRAEKPNGPLSPDP